MWLEVPEIQARLDSPLLSRCHRLLMALLLQNCWRQFHDTALVQAFMEETQRHDFCVSRELSVALADKTAQLLQNK